MGGTDAPDNLADLTPEEHYVAHQLLVKIHPGRLGLLRAANMMSKLYGGRRRYAWLRRRYAIAMRGNKQVLGYRHSAETLVRMSHTHRGKTHSTATRAKIAKANSGVVMSADRRAKIAAALRGKPVVRSLEGTARIAAAARKRMLSDANPMKRRAP